VGGESRGLKKNFWRIFIFDLFKPQGCFIFFLKKKRDFTFENNCFQKLLFMVSGFVSSRVFDSFSCRALSISGKTFFSKYLKTLFSSFRMLHLFFKFKRFELDI